MLSSALPTFLKSGDEEADGKLVQNCDPSILDQLQQAVNQSYLDEYYECLQRGKGKKPSFMMNFEDESSLLDDIENKPLEEIHCYFNIEEQAHLAFYKTKAAAYEALYHEFFNRTEFLLKVIKGIQELNIETVSEKEQLMTRYQDRIRELSAKNFELDNASRDLKIELSDKEDLVNLFKKKVDEKSSELQLFKGDQKMLGNLALETLIEVEQTFLTSLQIITKTKTKKILELQEDVKRAKENAESSKKCIICQQNNIEIVIKPCHHVIMCLNCSLRVSQCPLDRSEIDSQDRIFLG